LAVAVAVAAAARAVRAALKKHRPTASRLARR
jgi:hypothetical protein